MDESSKSLLRTLAALAFLGTLGALLARPIFSADDDPASTRRPAAQTQKSEEPQTPAASPTKEKPDAAAAAPLVYGDYPKACLRPVPAPAGTGLVAVFHYGAGGEPNEISIGSPAGGATATFPGMSPLQWSPTGRWLASRGLELHDPLGRAYRPFKLGGNEPWAWSPIADCLVVADRDRLVVLQPPDTKTVLLEGYGAGNPFFFSPDGRYLFTMRGGIDLRENPVRPIPVPSLSPTTCNVSRQLTQESCAPSGELVAAIDGGRLVLTDLEVSYRRPLTTDNGWIDAFPEWGPSRTGVLFIRTPEERGAPEVWFVAEGGNPRPTGLLLPDRKGVGKLDENEWPSYLDWNITPPDGVMPPILEE